MGLLDIETIFEEEKITTRVNAESIECFDIHIDESTKENRKLKVYGYEIHMGICRYGENAKPLFKIVDKNGEKVSINDGAINKKGNIMGTYIHGIFDGVDFREYILNKIRSQKGMAAKKSNTYENLRERELDKLADIVRQNLNIDKIYEIMGLKK